jgi:hypothetical protein
LVLWSGVWCGWPSESHTCVHSRLISSPQYRETNSSAARGRLAGLQITNPQPFRISHFHISESNTRVCLSPGTRVQIGNPRNNQECTDRSTGDCYYTCKAEDVMTQEKLGFLEAVLSETVAFFNSVLRVTRKSGNIVVKGASPCGDGAFTYPPTHTTLGVASADYVLYVTLRPTLGSVLAYAAHCPNQDDATTRRPLVGTANFSPARVLVGDPGLQAIVRHEITHALGFSESLFPMYAASPVTRTRIVTTRRTPYQITEVVSPKAVAAAREHFACPSLVGAELEDGGGSGTAGSHWEKTRFGVEYMVGTSTMSSAYSKVTFGLLEDSGWYAVDYTSQAISLNPWGYQAGCDFAQKSCTDEASWKAKGWPYWCDTSPEDTNQDRPSGCSVERAGINVCYVRHVTGETIPPQFQYYNDPTVSGSDLIDDYCPIPVMSRDCRDNMTKDDPADYYAARAEELGVNGGGVTSRCFDSSLFSTDLKYATIKSSKKSYGCYSSACAGPSSLYLRVKNHWYPCVTTVSGIYGGDFNGEIKCPTDSIRSLCGTTPEDPTWPVFGALVSPSKISRRGGVVVSITGTNFGALARIDVSGVDCEITAKTNTSATCTTSTSGTYDNDAFIRVSNARGFGTSSKKNSINVETKLGALFTSFKGFVQRNKIWVGLGASALVAAIVALCVLCQTRRKKRLAGLRRQRYSEKVRAKSALEMQKV